MDIIWSLGGAPTELFPSRVARKDLLLFGISMIVIIPSDRFSINGDIFKSNVPSIQSG